MNELKSDLTTTMPSKFIVSIEVAQSSSATDIIGGMVHFYRLRIFEGSDQLDDNGYISRENDSRCSLLKTSLSLESHQHEPSLASASEVAEEDDSSDCMMLNVNMNCHSSCSMSANLRLHVGCSLDWCKYLLTPIPHHPYEYLHAISLHPHANHLSLEEDDATKKTSRFRVPQSYPEMPADHTLMY